MKRLPPFLLRTSMGVITVELWPEKAPLTVQNFLAYAKDRFYDETLIHRVIDDFCIQGGGYAPGMIRKFTRLPIPNEARKDLGHDEGTLAMARDPNDPHSATSQWFINTRENHHLNHADKSDEKFGYCVFGRVIDGMKVVREIEALPVRTVTELENVPASDVMLESIRPLKPGRENSAR